MSTIEFSQETPDFGQDGIAEDYARVVRVYYWGDACITQRLRRRRRQRYD